MAKTKHADKRAAETKSCIQRVFLSLISEIGFKKISVRLICENAKVSRGTFYLYYEDKYALLDEVIDTMLELSSADSKQEKLTECQRICTDENFAVLYQDDEAIARIISRLVQRNTQAGVEKLKNDCNIDELEASALFAYMLYGNVAVNRMMNWHAGQDWEKVNKTIRVFAEGGTEALKAYVMGSACSTVSMSS